MSYIGANKIGKIYLGSTEIGKAYLGTDLVYQKSSGSSGTNYELEYLTLTALASTTISVISGSNSPNIPTISYSTNGGDSWLSVNLSKTETNLATLSTGNSMLLKATHGGGTSITGYFTIKGTGNFEASGNVMSLIYGDNFVGQTSLAGKKYTFRNLFKNSTKLISAENLVLPATTLADNCYMSMFYGCSSLITSPQKLPAKTLITSCYREMFYVCTSLTTTPELSATTLGESCYYGMFQNCNSLTTPPVLGAQSLKRYCYMYMFRGCTSLTTAPDLPARQLTSDCYYGMFYGCSNLNYIKAMFTTTPSSSYTTNWVNGVSSTGTFVKNSAATWNVTGNDGIPSGWTIQTASS